MKNIFKYTCISLLLMFLASCEDEELKRIPDFEPAPNVRFTFPDPELTLFNFDDLSNAKIRYNIYSQSLDIIDNISLKFIYTNAIGEVSDTLEIKNYTPADFTNGQIIGQEITAADMANALGLTLDDLNGGDVFTFMNFTTDINGKVYPDKTVEGYYNVTPNIINSSATSSFTTSFSALVGCPVAAPFTGTYLLESIADPGDPFNVDPYVFSPGLVNIESTGPIFRTFSFGYYEGVNFSFIVDFDFVLLCGQLIVPYTVTGIGCGGPTFSWIGDEGLTFDPNDDGELIISLTNNVDGACGVPSDNVQFKLVKQ